MTWRSIATDPPPKDGTKILVWENKHACPISVSWQSGFFTGWAWHDVLGRTQWPDYWFKYWQPIQPPPEETP